MGARYQLLSTGRGALPLPPRLEGAYPAGDQQPHDSENPIKYTTSRIEASPLPHRLRHQQLTNLHGGLTRIASLPKQFPRGCATNGAATAKSMDFGLSPGSLERGWGSGTSTTPQRRGEAPAGRPRCCCRGLTKGFPRVPTCTTNTTPSLALVVTPAPRSSKEEPARGRTSSDLQISRRRAVAPTHHDQRPLSPCGRDAGQHRGSHLPRVDSASLSRAAARGFQGPSQGRAGQHPTTGHPHQTPMRPHLRGGREGGRAPSSFQKR
jgi:hypothetical protein